MFFDRFKKKPKADDNNLLEQYRTTGDLALLGALYDRYMHLVYGTCLKYLKNAEDSKDAVMQIFEKIVESLLHTEVDNFKSWLYVVAKNYCLMQLRASKTRQQNGHYADHILENNMELGYNLHLDNDGKGTDEINLQLLEKGMNILPSEQKQCITLFYMEQKCYKEIEEITGYELKKVKSYIQNGKRNLKIFLEKQHGKTS